MADSLGTLWFGADVDLTKLKQSINQGNQSILDALKMSYDPQSYQQMVAKLKQQLASETFQINVSTNAQSVAQNLRQTLQGVGQAGNNVGFDLSGLQGIAGMKRDLIDQRDLVREITADVKRLEQQWRLMQQTYGSQSMQAKKAYAEYAAANRVLEEEKTRQFALSQTKARATLAQQELNKQKAEGSRLAKQLNSDHLRLNTTLAGGIHISTQLGSALSSLFAVHAARQFLDNVIEIGGQLEKQRISMQAILGDASRANVLFEQIKDLAIKSPFGVVELDQYSKQLAAYGIEQSKLFETTKRLADISAGAGQDIGRLALALGHVKSATYLTGITLRQFSMNNIPMLKMLADYYTEIEKRAVSTAEVQKRISARQVSYEDVAEQIKRMTDEGGQFYNMQEKISESLQAKFKNLRDSFDIMYGEIAESAIGSGLKDLAALLTTLSRNWEKVVDVLAVAATGLAVWRISTVAASRAMAQFGAETVLTSTRLSAQRIIYGGNKAALQSLSAATVDNMVKQQLLTREQLLNAVATKRLTVAQAELAATNFNVSRAELVRIASMGRMGLAMRSLTIGARSLGIALKGLLFNPFTIILTAVTTVLEVFMNVKRKNDEMKESIKDVASAANEGFKNITDTYNKYAKLDAEGMDANAIRNNIKDIVEALNNYHPRAKDIIEEANEVDSLAERYTFLKKKLEETRDAYADMEKHSDVAVSANDDTGNLINDTLAENVKQYIDDLANAKKAENDFFQHRIAIQKALDKIASGNKDFAVLRYNVDKDGNKTLKSLKEQIDILRTIKIPNVGTGFNVFSQLIAQDSNTASRALGEWSVALSDVDKRLTNEVMPDLDSFADYIDNVFKKDYGEDWKKNETHVTEATKLIEIELNKIPGMTDAVRNDLMRKIFNDKWEFSFKFRYDDVEEELTGWQAEMQKYFDEHGIKIRLTMGSSREDIIKQIGEERDKWQKIADNSGKVLIGIGLKLDSLPDSLSGSLNTPWNSSNLIDNKAANAYITALNDAIKQFNLNVKPPKGSNSGNKNSVDKQLKEWKEQLKELENFYKVYKRNVEYMTKDDAIQKALDSGVFKITKESVKDIDDYLKVLKDFRDKVQAELGKKPSTERRSFLTDLLTKIDEKEFEVKTKQATETILKSLEREIETQSKKWDLYKKIFDATGNKSQAATIAFGNAISFDNMAEELRDKINKALEKLPEAKAEGIDKLLGMDDDQLKNLGIFEKSADGVYKMLKKLYDVEQSLKEEDIDLFLDALKNAKSLETELEQIENKYKKTIDAIKKNGNLSESDKNTLIANAEQNWATENSNKQWEYFKKNTEDWGRIFGNLDKVSSQTLQMMLEKLREVAPSVNDSVEATKALYDAMDKISDALNSRNPFAAMADSLKKMSAYRNAIDFVKKNFGDVSLDTTIGFDAATAKKLGIGDGTKGWSGTVAKLFDAMQESSDKFVQSIGAIGNTFQGLQDVLSPVINLFDKLGNSTLSGIFQTGSNALGSAAQVAGGFSTLSQAFGDGKSGLSGLLGSAGPYAAAAAAALSVASSLFAMHDAALQEEIDASKERVKIIENLSKGLEKAFERTLNAIQNAQMSEREEAIFKQYLFKYGIATSGDYSGMLGASFKRMFGYIQDDTIDAINKALESDSYYNTKLAELYIQRDEITKQLNAEKAKKDSDAGAISDYEAQLEDLNDQIKNFAIDMAKALYDIDVKSWASELTDAVVEAWENGEDAVDAYKKKVKDMMKDLTTNILAQRILEQRLKDLKFEDLIAKLMNTTNGILNEDAIPEIAKVLGQAGETSVEAITAILDKLEELGYISKAEAEETAANIDTIKSAFEDLLSDPTQDVEEWGKNFRNQLIKEFIQNTLLGEEFKKWAKEWGEEYTQLMTDYESGAIDAETFKRRQAEMLASFDQMANSLSARGKELMEGMGYVWDSSELTGAFSGLRDTFLDTLMDMEEDAEAFRKKLEETMIRDVIDQNIFSKAFSVGDVDYTNLDDYIKKWNERYAAAVAANDQTLIDQLLAELGEVRGMLIKDTETLRDRLKEISRDTTFEDMSDNWVSTLMDMSKTAEDFAQDIGKTMAEKIIKEMVAPTLMKPLLTQLQNVFNEAMEAGTSTNEEGKTVYNWEAVLNYPGLQQAIDEITAKYPEIQGVIKRIMEMLGLDTSHYKYDGFSNLGDSILNSLKSAEGNIESWAKEMGATMAEDMAKAYIDSQYGKRITELNEEWQKALEAGNTDMMKSIEDDLNTLYSDMANDPKLQELIDKFRELAENPFKDMASDFASSLMDMEQSAEDFANNIAKNLTQEMITKVIKDQYQGKIDALGEQWKQALEQGDSAAIERIRQQLEVLYGQMGDAVKPLLDAISDIGKETDKTFSSMTDSWVSALMDMEGTAEDFAQSVGKTMAQKIITELIAPTYIQPILDAMQKAYNLAIAVPGATISSVLAQMTPFIGQIEDVYRQIQPMIEEIFGTIGIVADSVEEAAEEVEYALSDMKSNFVSALMDMTNSAEDFSRDISKILAQSFIEKFVLGDAFDAQMKRWQEQYESIIGSGMSEDERKKQLRALRDAIAQAKEGYVNSAMAIQELLGLGTEDSQEATMNMADKITYDQADQLLGIGLAQLLTQEQMLSILKGDASLSTPMFDSLVGDTASNDENSQMIAATMQSLLDVTRNNTDNILAQVAISNNHLYAISEYTKSIKGMLDEHLVSMDNKLTNLSRL